MKPTIKELEDILNRSDSDLIETLPNGEIKFVDIKKLKAENKALKESRDELLFFLKGLQGEIPRYHRYTSGELINKAEALKEKEHQEK